MPQFDPRREPLRFAPSLAAISLAICVAGVTMGTRAEPAAKESKPAAAAAKPSKPEAKPSKAKPVKAAAKPEKTEAKPTKVAAKPEKPDDKPAKVAAKPAKPEAKPTKVAAKPAKPEATPAKPEAKPTRQAAKPADKPVKAAAKPAEAPGPSYGAAQTIKVKLRKGETLEAAIRRAEAAPDEAKAAASKVEKALGAAPKPGQLFTVEVAPREGRVGAGRLMKLTLKSDGEPLVVTRGDKGAMTVTARRAAAGSVEAAENQDETPAVRGSERAQLISGEVRGSLFASARRAGMSGGQVGEIVRVFAAKLDFQRDLKAGDRFTVVHDHKGQLLYARIKTKGSYRFARSGGQVLWLDENGKSLKAGLLRSPVDGARMSSRFGMRRHPILGYQRMHQGIDFAAPSGTPIMAAGDGVVTKIARWGGYGNWLQIRHSGGYESGYAHLSRYASGLKVGDKVRQGELVAYVGSTGASTGPHLHHEIWLNGRRVDPKGAKIPQGFALEGRELVAFQAQRARVQAVLSRGEPRMAGGKAKVAGLRPAKDTEA